MQKLDREWILITKYQKIRNVIVHSNSNIKKELDSNEKQKSVNILKEFKGIEINESTGDFMILNSSFVNEFLDCIEKYLLDLFKFVKDKKFRTFGIDNETSYYWLHINPPPPFNEDDLPF